MRLFSGTLDAMNEAFEHGKDPLQFLDEAVGWDRLMGILAYSPKSPILVI